MGGLLYATLKVTLTVTLVKSVGAPVVFINPLMSVEEVAMLALVIPFGVVRVIVGAVVCSLLTCPFFKWSNAVGAVVPNPTFPLPVHDKTGVPRIFMSVP